MSTLLVLSFPLGRYHATPWGHQVNEGTVELPPSPWRILRTLYAVWRNRAPELDDDTMHGLLARLAEPPSVHVPQHTTSHTRHYYKTMTQKNGQPETDRTLDAFAVFDRDAELAVEWPFDLPDPQAEALRRLAGSIPYLGRADSVCIGAVAPEWTPTGHDTWRPVDVADSIDPDLPTTTVLAPALPLDVATILATPAEVRKAGLPMPAGTRLVGYQRFAAAPIRRPQPRRTGRTATTVRFSLLQPGLPPATDALVYTDLLRRAAIDKLGRHPDGTTLGGRTATGAPATGNHGHAHFLPLFTPGRRLSGLVVWAPDGLGEDELAALTSVRNLYSGQNEAWRATLRVAGIGSLDDTAPELRARPPATAWRSITPFTPARFPKRRQSWNDHLVTDVRRELGYRGIDTDCGITVVDDDWVTFRRYRPSARARRDNRQGQARQASAMLRLTFTAPVHGPIALGHLAHFGLGLFLPEQNQARF